MLRRIDPIKVQYKKTSEFALVMTLFMLTVLFTASKRFDQVAAEQIMEANIIDVINVPIFKEERKLEPPKKPTLPIEAEDEDIPDDATIDMTEINWDAVQDVPPPPDEGENEVKFTAYDTPPEVVGGFAQIAKKLVYPELAVKAGVEGRVIIEIKLSKTGQILDAKVVQSLGNNGCDEAAIEAIKSVKWKPAYQRDKPVNVIVSIPVIFRLK
jgi:protein TonB